jgi:phosphocarrier protein
MLTLGIEQNDAVTVEADGEQEEQAVAELGQLLATIFE